LLRAAGGGLGIPRRTAVWQIFVSLLPLLTITALLAVTYRSATAPVIENIAPGLIEFAAPEAEESPGLIGAQPLEEEKPAGRTAPSQAAPPGPVPARTGDATTDGEAPGPAAEDQKPARLPAPPWFWVTSGIAALALLLIYGFWSWERHEIFKMLLTSFFPLSILILGVLGSILFGFATPTEAAAVGAFGGFVLAVVYRFAAHWREGRSNGRGGGASVKSALGEIGYIVKESSFLTAKTSAMVCWLFVGSAIFSAAFALLGGQEIVERWVLSMELTPLQFLILAQFIIFILGWPLEWTEIIVIFMPIFIPLLSHFNIDPLFFGILVALNLQTAFLSPPVAMAAFYLKGVSPPHVTLNQIFDGMMPFMGIQLIALVLLYLFPQLALWLPALLYR
jgi:TRAP-type mannitol/chloroaromatic compound transport system permease large subunit